MVHDRSVEAGEAAQFLPYHHGCETPELERRLKLDLKNTVPEVGQEEMEPE